MPLDQPFIEPNSQEAIQPSGENVKSAELDLRKTESVPPQGEVRSDNTIGQDDQPLDPSQTSGSVVTDQAAPATTVSDDTVSSQAVLDDTAELKGDDQFIGQVRKIINDDKENPFLEESDSEELQEKYLKSRFGVDVDLEKEAK